MPHIRVVLGWSGDLWRFVDREDNLQELATAVGEVWLKSLREDIPHLDACIQTSNNIPGLFKAGMVKNSGVHELLKVLIFIEDAGEEEKNRIRQKQVELADSLESVLFAHSISATIEFAA